MICTAGSPSAAEDGPILHYSFDDDREGQVFDESDHGNNGGTVGDVRYEPSFRGRAVRFTGNTTYVTCDSPGIDMDGWKQVTLSVWVKVNKVTTYGRVVSRGNVSGEKSSGVGLRVGGETKATWSVLTQSQNNIPV
jgi:hypothetical protein